MFKPNNLHNPHRLDNPIVAKASRKNKVRERRAFGQRLAMT